MTNRKLALHVSSIIVTLEVVCLCFPFPVHAFLATSGISLIAALLLPQILFFCLNILLTLIAFLKRKKTLSLILLITLITFAVYIVSKYLFLKNLNANPVIDVNGEILSEEKEWTNFKDSISTNPTTNEKIWFNFQQGGLDVANSVNKLEVTTYEPEKYTQIIGHTYSDFTLKETAIDLIGNFFLKICDYAFDETALEQFLTEQGITKKDKILVYCPSGTTSRVVAFILNHYGYQIHYLPLSKAENLSFENQEEVLLNQNLFVIQKVNESQLKDYQYIYFMLMINDYSHSFLKQYYCEGKPLPDNPHIYKIDEDNIELVTTCPSNTNFQIKLDQLHIPFFNRDEILSLPNARILCSDKWQCFLTKHLLYEQDLYQNFSTLYCLDCEH